MYNKQRFLIIIISCFLMFSACYAENIQSEYDYLPIVEQNTYETPKQDETIQSENLDTIPPVLEQQPVHIYKEPISKKKLAKKFIIAMICVAGASILLYVILTLYNKLREIVKVQDSDEPANTTSLDTPSDITEAVKSFVEKTRW